MIYMLHCISISKLPRQICRSLHLNQRRPPGGRWIKLQTSGQLTSYQAKSLAARGEISESIEVAWVVFNTKILSRLIAYNGIRHHEPRES